MIARDLRYPAGWPAQPAQEKGIDVALAVDFVMMAARREFDVGVLFSSDTDLVPALEAVVALRPGRRRHAKWQLGLHPACARACFPWAVWAWVATCSRRRTSSPWPTRPTTRVHRECRSRISLAAQGGPHGRAACRSSALAACGRRGPSPLASAHGARPESLALLLRLRRSAARASWSGPTAAVTRCARAARRAGGVRRCASMMSASITGG